MMSPYSTPNDDYFFFSHAASYWWGEIIHAAVLFLGQSRRRHVMHWGYISRADNGPA